MLSSADSHSSYASLMTIVVTVAVNYTPQNISRMNNGGDKKNECHFQANNFSIFSLLTFQRLNDKI